MSILAMDKSLHGAESCAKKGVSQSQSPCRHTACAYMGADAADTISTCHLA